MKTKLYEMLNFLPIFILVANGENFKLKLNLVEMLRSFIVPLIVSAVSVFVTIQVMKNDLQHYAVAATEVKEQVTILCREFGEWRVITEKRMTTLETRQAERLEREAAAGVRKFLQ